MEKFLENLYEAEKIIKTADHLVYMTFPLVKDKRLLIKVISEIKKSLAYCINSVLQYEYLYKKIKLYPNPETNFKTFKEKSAQRYNINEQEIKKILEIFQIVEKHKKSSMEFIKDEKVVILSANMSAETVNLEQIKEFLALSKNILQKIKQTMLQ